MFSIWKGGREKNGKRGIKNRMWLLRVVFAVLVVLFAVLAQCFYMCVLDSSSSDYSDDDDGAVRSSSGKEVVVSFSRVYRDVNVNSTRGHWSSNDLFTGASEGDYVMGQKIGRGRHSDVYLGTERATGTQYAVKVLKPAAPARVAREVRVMKTLAGCPNVAAVHDVFENARGKVSIVQSLAKGVSCKAFMKREDAMTANETRHIARMVLEALDCAHSRGIMHRDVKPHNIVYDNETGAVNLIDWGLAEFYLPGQRYNVSVATSSYKPPELLMGMRYYDYSLDMWSFGCVLAEMLFGGKEALFRGSTRCKVLRNIVRTLGSKPIFKYADKYNLTVPCKRKIDEFDANPLCGECKSIDPDALDLLEKVLVVDHSKRVSAAEALQHPYFYD